MNTAWSRDVAEVLGTQRSTERGQAQRVEVTGLEPLSRMELWRLARLPGHAIVGDDWSPRAVAERPFN
jgi:hypothetical protein